MNVIEINSENYKDYLHLDIIAFSFAGEGAQGEGGGLWMVTSDGKLYHTNFAYTISWEQAILRALKKVPNFKLHSLFLNFNSCPRSISSFKSGILFGTGI